MLGLSNAMTSGSHHEQQYSLELDGTNDYLATQADGTLASKTYSFWMKASVTGENGGVFGHGGVATGAKGLRIGSYRGGGALANYSARMSAAGGAGSGAARR